MKAKQPPKVTANIGDIIESLKIVRDAHSNLRSLPSTIELAALRGSTPQQLADLVKTAISDFIDSITPEEN